MTVNINKPSYWLRRFCKAPMSVCEAAGNCDSCVSINKDAAEKELDAQLDAAAYPPFKKI